LPTETPQIGVFYDTIYMDDYTKLDSKLKDLLRQEARSGRIKLKNSC